MSAKSVSVAENFVHQADALKEFLPVKFGNQAHAGDDVAHGHAHGSLLLVLGADNFIGVRSRKGQALIEPNQNGPDLWVQIPQALDKLHGKRSFQGSFLKALKGRKDCGLPIRPEQAIGQRVGFLAGRPAAYNPFRHPAQIFDQHDAEGDGHRPELANRQRLHPLIGRHKAAQHFGVESAIRMRHKRPSNSVHARIAFQVTRCELGQLAVVACRQIILDLAKLFIDDVEVVDQPFRRRRDRMLVLNRPSDGAVGISSTRPFSRTRGRSGRPRLDFVRDDLRRRKALGVLLEPLQAEEFSADRLFQIRKKNGRRLIRTHCENQTP